MKIISRLRLIAIAKRAEQLEILPQAVSDIRRVLSQPGCTWQDYWAVATEYEVIKADYWAELTIQETELITALQKASGGASRIESTRFVVKRKSRHW